MTAELFSEIGRLRVENYELSGTLARVRAELVSEALRSEDLAEALYEACDVCDGVEGCERQVARWRRLLASA